MHDAHVPFAWANFPTGHILTQVFKFKKYPSRHSLQPFTLPVHCLQLAIQFSHLPVAILG